MNVRPQDPTSGRSRLARVLAITAAVGVVGAGTSAAHADVVPWPSPSVKSTNATGTMILNAIGDTPRTRYRIGTRVLRKGMRGTDVRGLQIRLRNRGFQRIMVDGDFGKQTRRFVKRFQLRKRLTPDGVVGKLTFAKLGVAMRTIRTTPTTPPPTIAPGDYPLVGPNAANAKYLKAFPVAGKHTYFNDFGAPRAQGTHQGNDIMADRGIPVRAVAAGTIWKANRVESGLGGIYLWLRDAKGTDYYYAHLTTIAKGINVGSTVTVGQVLGTVGNTGDARYGAPHLHFEIRPAGIGPVNPYRDLLAVDPEPPVRN